MPSDEMPRPGDGFVLRLPYDPDAAGVARRFVAEHAAGLPAELTADAQLLVSELVTNAIRYGEPAVTLSVRLDPPYIGVGISDSGAHEEDIVAGHATPSQTRGRGLMILDALSTRWGIARAEPPPGKTVWFELRKDTDERDVT